jgi:hypothetical protein
MWLQGHHHISGAAEDRHASEGLDGRHLQSARGRRTSRLLYSVGIYALLPERGRALHQEYHQVLLLHLCILLVLSKYSNNAAFRQGRIVISLF